MSLQHNQISNFMSTTYILCFTYQQLILIVSTMDNVKTWSFNLRPKLCPRRYSTKALETPLRHNTSFEPEEFTVLNTSTITQLSIYYYKISRFLCLFSDLTLFLSASQRSVAYIFGIFQYWLQAIQAGYQWVIFTDFSKIVIFEYILLIGLLILITHIQFIEPNWRIALAQCKWQQNYY